MSGTNTETRFLVAAAGYFAQPNKDDATNAEHFEAFRSLIHSIRDETLMKGRSVKQGNQESFQPTVILFADARDLCHLFDKRLFNNSFGFRGMGMSNLVAFADSDAQPQKPLGTWRLPLAAEGRIPQWLDERDCARPLTGSIVMLMTAEAFLSYPAWATHKIASYLRPDATASTNAEHRCELDHQIRHVGVICKHFPRGFSVVRNQHSSAIEKHQV